MAEAIGPAPPPHVSEHAAAIADSLVARFGYAALDEAHRIILAVKRRGHAYEVETWTAACVLVAWKLQLRARFFAHPGWP